MCDWMVNIFNVMEVTASITLCLCLKIEPVKKKVKWEAEQNNNVCLNEMIFLAS
jgi:hypothetical protein